MRRSRRSTRVVLVPLLRRRVGIMPAAPRRPRPPRRARTRGHWRRYAVLAVALYCGFIGRRDLGEYLRLRAAIHALNVRQQQALTARASLQAQIAYAQSDTFVSAAARQEFGMVSPGQVPLAPIEPAGSPTRP